MNKNQRIDFYLGKNKDIPHENMNESSITVLTSGKNPHDTSYDVPLKQLLTTTKNSHQTFSFQRGDVISAKQQHNWSLSKNRGEGNEDAVLLRCFNIQRHWGLYYQKPNDLPFDKKKNVAFWRGTTTGCSDHFSAQHWNPKKVNRFTLLEKWFGKHPSINVAFSFIHRDWLKKRYNKYVKGICPSHLFLCFKYVISVEGNDKDSGLNWKLNSNSVVFMPKPRITSWLMETTLIPNFHYVLLQDDFSDLLEKVEWCNNNQDKCKEIVKNANSFMKQFSNNLYEEELEKSVLNQYFNLKDKLTCNS
jgi:hypothetical protein